MSHAGNAYPRTSVGSNVRAEAVRRGRSQADLASVLGLSQTGISRRLSGKIDFSSTELEKLAGFLSVPVATFFGEFAVQNQPPALAESGEKAS